MAVAQSDALPGESLIKQGAEALAFISTILPSLNGITSSLGHKCVRKHRPPKPYRHPVLDKRLTTHRILMESRLLQRLRRANVPVPAVLFVDVLRGDLFMEYIDGQSIRDYLLSNHPPSNPDTTVTMTTAHSSTVKEVTTTNGTKDMTTVDGRHEVDEEDIRRVMREIGRIIAGMHAAEVCHGDLTTSNVLLTHDGRVILIDFGLGSVSVSIEDYAVDLYVLERAFLSTHPSSGEQFDLIIEGYLDAATKTRGQATIKRLEAVRLRGRKRTMVG